MSLHTLQTNLELELSFEGRVQSLVKSSSLLISLLEVGGAIVSQQVDQSVRVLTPLAVQILHSYI